MPVPLPSRPYLPFYRKQAKALLKAWKAADPEACARLSRLLSRFAQATPAEVAAAGLKLSDAQWVVAREHGFESWAKFKAHVEALTTGRAGRHRPFVTELSYYEERAEGLLKVLQGGLRSACRLVQEWHPDYAAATEAEILAASLTRDDARLIFAREHGFDDWKAFARQVERLAAGEVEEPFQAVFEAVKAREVDRLRELLEAHPELARAYGTNGNTLLNLATSTFDHGDHSRSPGVAPESESTAMQVIRLLLERGADPDQGNNRGFTPLHAAAYGNNVPLVRAFLEAGASVRLSGHGDGGTPLVQALFWGHREAAELLAEREIVPFNLRVAAGLGRIDLLRVLLLPDGALKPEAFDHREFYRPHSGFPAWKPVDDRQQVLDEAASYAARNGRTEALEWLLDRGADLHGEPYFGTPLHWAAWNGHTETVRRLVARGADVNLRGKFGAEGGLTPLHAAAWHGQLQSARVLVETGADPSRPDPRYFSPPWGWAGFFGHPEVKNFLLPVAARVDLFAAATLGDVDSARAMLARDPRAVNPAGFYASPLSQAAGNGHAALVELLLEHGADPNAGDAGSGQTPLDRALASGHEGIAERLRRAGGRRSEETNG